MQYTEIYLKNCLPGTMNIKKVFIFVGLRLESQYKKRDGTELGESS